MGIHMMHVDTVHVDVDLFLNSVITWAMVEAWTRARAHPISLYSVFNAALYYNSDERSNSSE